MRIISFVLILALLFPLTARADITFVSSDDELNQALVLFDGDEIETLAVSQAFYQGSAKQTKNRIRGLLSGLSARQEMGLYIYGAFLDGYLVKDFLGDTSGVECEPKIFVGKLRTHRGDVVVCGGGSESTEDYIRLRIIEADNSTRGK